LGIGRIEIVSETDMLLEDRRKVVKVLKDAIAGLEKKENFDCIAEQVARLRVTVAEQERIIEEQGVRRKGEGGE
jgi:hypothetical protein